MRVVRARPRPLSLLAAVAALALTAFPGLPASAATGPPGTAAAAVAVTDPAQYVNTFVGTKPGATDFGNGGGAGNTFPGADAPFGMLQWSPDTVTYQHGGYFYDDNRIRGFSLTHISGAGCGDYGNVPFMPVLGGSPVSYSTFSHANESAAPGSYAVTFDNGLRTELAVTQRSGIARFTYPASSQKASLYVDAAKAFNAASGSVTVGTNTLSGYQDSGGFCGAGNRYRVHFHVTFDRPFATAATVVDGKVDTARRSASGSSAGIAPQLPKTARAQAGSGVRAAKAAHPQDVRAAAAAAFVSFNLDASRTVTARVGISFTSLAGAQANLSTEQGSRTFEQVRDGTRAAWNALLGRVAVSGGTTDSTRLLYTGLYHSLLFPAVFSDVNGQYMGFDNQVHSTVPGHVQYADYSGWDVYRSQVQLVALLAPKEAADIAQSAVNQSRYGGYLDRWTLANGGTGVMVGDPLSIIIAAMYAFGGTDFDARDALSRMVAGSKDDRQRPAHTQYDAQGYIPTSVGVWGPTATTLEYTSADMAVAALAQRLGDTATHDTYLRRAQNWRNLFNPGNHYIQPRNSNGTWPSFSPTSENSYVEGDGAQYTWMVPYNYRGLFDAMGGNATVRSRLDTFFTELNAGPSSAYAYLGNEPSLEAPWAYAWAGAPYRTQDVVRRALTTIFKPTPDGEVGNDDLGEMASWTVWAALGMYPEIPGRAELVLASPLFPQVTITRGNGVTIDITAPGASVAAKYVQSLQVNGQATTKAWLPESFVRDGGTLAFTVGTSPNTSWGSAAADAPPSFDVSNPPPPPPPGGAIGPITGLAGKCVDVDHSGTANGTKIQLWTCNGTGAQQWTVGGDGTLQALGKCMDVTYGGTANGTKIQLWDCNGTGAQVWQARSNGALVNPQSGRCLDVPNSNTADGTQLQIYDCNGTGAQTWTLPGAAARRAT